MLNIKASTVVFLLVCVGATALVQDPKHEVLSAAFKPKAKQQPLKIVELPGQPKQVDVASPLATKTSQISSSPRRASISASPSQTKAAEAAAKPLQPKGAASAKYAQPSVTRMVSTRTHLKVGETSSQPTSAMIVSKLQVVNSSGNLSSAGGHKKSIGASEETVSKLPMASFALDVPQPVKNASREHASRGNATQKAGPMKRGKYYGDHVTASSSNMSANHEHTASKASTNFTHVESHKNETRSLEEAAKTLPMASFALDMTQPAKNVTNQQKKMPGSATQKAAYTKHKKLLKGDIATEKAHVKNVPSAIHKSYSIRNVEAAAGTFNSHKSSPSAFSKRHSTPKMQAAAGTFNSHLDGRQVEDGVKDAKVTLASTLVVSKVAAPTEKAQTPGATPASGPVAIKANSAADLKKGGIEAHQGKAQGLVVDTAFLGKPHGGN